VPAAESYPDDLRYHPEHDWARIDGDEATLGVTWFAQDSLGELVHYRRPRPARR
jgi:glycine cleavage system H protein